MNTLLTEDIFLPRNTVTFSHSKKTHKVIPQEAIKADFALLLRKGRKELFLGDNHQLLKVHVQTDDSMIPSGADAILGSKEVIDHAMLEG